MAEVVKSNTKHEEKPRVARAVVENRHNFAFALVAVISAAAMYSLAPYLMLGLDWVGQVLSKPTSASPQVKVLNGTYAGVCSREFKQDFFLGMPYAKPPERFTLSEGLDQTWNGVHDAKKYPPHCVGYGDDMIGYEQSEDCLYINVVRPAGIDETAELPVAVWIHGGGLVMGGSADRRYNLSFIVDQSVKMGTPMIGVSFNYRLSAFGFLNGKEALQAGVTNIGFRDQRLALRWVQENIAAFGGSSNKVTIWGESSGAESVSAQVLAYNGRDDGLFRAAIGQSGFGGMLPRLPGGFNATDLAQTIFDSFLSSTSCADTVGTAESIDCLRKAPFEEINATLASSGASYAWPPVLDGDFFQDYTEHQLNLGHFAQVPLLVGTNTDEGTGFGMGRGPGGQPVNTDEEFKNALLPGLGGENTDETPEELAAELMKLYPNDQSVGVPSLETWPHVIRPGDSFAQQLGAQFRRVSSVFGDHFMHYARRRANLVWTDKNLPSYAYRFNVIPNGIPEFLGSLHFQEVAFVFLNLNGDGYAVNPFGQGNETYTTQAKELSRAMGSAWVNFITGLDPNGADGLPNGIIWPAYSASGKIGQDLVWDLGEKSVAESDGWRQEAMAWFIDHALSVFGN